MFNAQGVWKRQRVYLSRTRDGMRALFTGAFVALPVKESDTLAQVAALAERCGFEFVS